MRKALYGILMAATAGAVTAPAFAQDNDRAQARYERQGQRNAARAERQQQRQEVRVERQQQRQEVQVERQAARPEPIQRQEVRQQRIDRAADNRGQQGGGSWAEAMRERAEARQAQRADGQQDRRADRWENRQERREERVENRQDRRDGRWDNRQERREERVENRQDRRGDRWDNRQDRREAWRDHVQETREASRRSGEGAIPSYQRQGERNQRRYERDLREDRREWREDRRDYRQARRWDRQWRRDGRFDWQRHRYSNRHLYSRGRYWSPFRDHRYSRLSIGFYLGSPFYSDRYWINDPWQYRLPPAYEGTRWIRYYNDVLLIDLYTGEVIDVIYDFFW